MKHETHFTAAALPLPTARLEGHCYALDFSRWKRSFIPAFLGDVQLQFIKSTALPALVPGDNVLVWSSKLNAEVERRCREAGATLWRMEDGFVRSVGLGMDRVPPLSLVLDARGIYYDATASSDLEWLLSEATFTPDQLQRAARVRHTLLTCRLSKYNVGKARQIELPAGRRLVLVPGQVESDASIAKGSPDIKTNVALLRAVRAANPDAFIIYKPHPDVVGGGRYGALKAEHSDGLFDLQLSDVDISTLLDRVDEVHTLSSLTGFEALLRGCKVVTYGLPFYAGWGLTEDRCRCPRRNRRLSLEALVAAVLILYPRYVDPHSGELISVEAAIAILVGQRDSGAQPGWKNRLSGWLYRLFRNVFLRF